MQFLQWFCPPNLYEGIEGDMLEQYENDVAHYGKRKAQRRLAWNVVKFFRPGIVLRNKFSIQLIQGYMLQNYLKVMLRTMMKHKTNSIINVMGLTVGITFSMLVGIYSWTELQVNKDLKDVERLYIVESSKEASNGFSFLTPSPLAKETHDQYPSVVENYYRFWDRNMTISKGDKHFRIQGMIGDSTLINMFGLPVLHGNIKKVFDDPNAIVITKAVAIKYFGKSNVVGETLTVSTEVNDNQKSEYEIKAVLDDLKSNSFSDLAKMNAQVFLSLRSGNEFSMPKPDEWGNWQIASTQFLLSGSQ